MSRGDKNAHTSILKMIQQIWYSLMALSFDALPEIHAISPATISESC